MVRDVVELEPLDAAEGRRPRSSVDDEVDDTTPSATHQLRLALPSADVQAAQHGVARPRLVVLHELGLEPRVERHQSRLNVRVNQPRSSATTRGVITNTRRSRGPHLAVVWATTSTPATAGCRCPRAS